MQQPGHKWLTSGYTSEKNKNTNLKRDMHPSVHSSIIYNSQDMEATYASIKKNEIMQGTATWMDFEGIMLSEISQTEKDKYYMISFICEI